MDLQWSLIFSPPFIIICDEINQKIGQQRSVNKVVACFKIKSLSQQINAGLWHFSLYSLLRLRFID